MRRFELVRVEDVSGISGTGVVAEGVQFSNGRVALTWNSKYLSVEITENMLVFEALHGHGGKSLVRWVDK
jgi:hypothetical protein